MPTLTPREADFVESAATKVTTIVELKATQDEVWAVLTDSERWPEWFPAAKACRITSENPEGVGSIRWMHFDLFKVHERFVAWEPPRHWAFTILDANLPGIVSVVEQADIEPVDDTTTRVTYVLAADVAPYMRPMVPFLKWRLGNLFAQGLPGIEGQAAKLREETA